MFKIDNKYNISPFYYNKDKGNSATPPKVSHKIYSPIKPHFKQDFNLKSEKKTNVNALKKIEKKEKLFFI